MRCSIAERRAVAVTGITNRRRHHRPTHVAIVGIDRPRSLAPTAPALSLASHAGWCRPCTSPWRPRSSATVLLGSTVRLLASLMHGQALPLGSDALEQFSFPIVSRLGREGQSFFSASPAFFGSRVCRL
jgi:hypothetical protein